MVVFFCKNFKLKKRWLSFSQRLNVQSFLYGRLFLVTSVWDLNQIRIFTSFLCLITGINVFDYIDRVHVKMPVFYNFMYSLDLQQTVLRPYCNISDFQIWDYYLAEELRHGPSYDYVRTHHMFSRILNFFEEKKCLFCK